MASDDPRRETDRAGLRALAHPLRLRMLSLLTGAPFSAAELARELGISQALASYHLRRLHGAGVIELAEVRARRGGRERRFAYRADLREPTEPAGHDLEGLAVLAEAMAIELRRRSPSAMAGERRLVIDAELWVDRSDWEATVAAMRAAGEELHRRAMPPRTPGTIRVSTTAMLFGMADDG